MFEEQCGFTTVTDHLHTISQLLMKKHEKWKEIHLIFIDVEKCMTAYLENPHQKQQKTPVKINK